MIVVAPRVAGDPTPAGFTEFRRVRPIRVVELAHADDALCRRKQIAWIAAQIASAIGKIPHLARKTCRTPRFKTRKVFERNGGCNAGEFEAALAGERLNLFGGNGQASLRLLPSFFILNSALLELRNISVQRGGRLALNCMDLRIEQGEHVAILGPNGSGKSTLIKLLTRECYPLAAAGSKFEILGRSNWNIFDLRSHLGIVSNDLMARCTRDITGRELVLSGFFGSVGVWPNHHVTDEMRAAARIAMEQLDVAHLADRWTDEVSSGEARRLLIARALIHHPSTLLLDEPATSLDVAAVRELRDHLRSLAKGGVSLLLVTHHLEEIIPEIERVVLLKFGSVYADGSKAEILTAKRLSTLFDVPVNLKQERGIYRTW